MIERYVNFNHKITTTQHPHLHAPNRATAAGNDSRPSTTHAQNTTNHPTPSLAQPESSDRSRQRFPVRVQHTPKTPPTTQHPHLHNPNRATAAGNDSRPSTTHTQNTTNHPTPSLAQPESSDRSRQRFPSEYNTRPKHHQAPYTLTCTTRIERPPQV